MKKDSFILYCSDLHNNKYDYSLIPEEFKSSSYIKIICPEHGIFKQVANEHKRGRGCRYCSKNSRKKSTSTFIKEAKELHGDRYDYSRVNYINSHTKVEIICPKHGSFFQMPHNHLNKAGCRKCANEIETLRKTKPFNVFLKEASRLYDNKYFYLECTYIKGKSPISIVCPIHGVFKVRPANHLNGIECPECTGIISSYEKQIRDVLEIKHKCVFNYRPKWLIPKGFSKPCEIDVYIKNLNIAIEFNGNGYHASSPNPLIDEIKPKTYHEDKYLLCKKHGINLIHIFEFEDFEEWLLILYQLRKETNISFENNKRVYKNLIYYGESIIKKL